MVRPRLCSLEVMAPTEYELFVRGLPGDVTQEELQEVFSTYGDVEGVRILPSDRRGKRAAVVTYSDAEDAEDAMEALNGVYKIREEEEAPIKVKWAPTTPAPAPARAAQEPEECADAGEAVAAVLLRRRARGGQPGDAWAEDGAVEPGADSQHEAHSRPSEGHKLFVGNLPGDCGEQELRAVFTTYGEVGGVRILK